MIEVEDTPVVGQAETLEEINEIPDMVAHLYRPEQPRPRVSKCGIPSAVDPHSCFHRANGITANHKPGETHCPACGAPICQVCLNGAPRDND